MQTGWKASREGKQGWSKDLKACHMRKELALFGLEKRRLRWDLVLQRTLSERSCHCHASNISTKQQGPDSKMEALLRQQKCLVALTLWHHPSSQVSTSSVLQGCNLVTLGSDSEHQKEGGTAVQRLLCYKGGKISFWLHHAKAQFCFIERSTFLCFKWWHFHILSGSMVRPKPGSCQSRIYLQWWQ